MIKQILIGLLFVTTCLAAPGNGPYPSGGGGDGSFTNLPSTSNLLSGNGSGGASDSGIIPSNVVTANSTSKLLLNNNASILTGIVYGQATTLADTNHLFASNTAFANGFGGQYTYQTNGTYVQDSGGVINSYLYLSGGVWHWFQLATSCDATNQNGGFITGVYSSGCASFGTIAFENLTNPVVNLAVFTLIHSGTSSNYNRLEDANSSSVPNDIIIFNGHYSLSNQVIMTNITLAGNGQIDNWVYNPTNIRPPVALVPYAGSIISGITISNAATLTGGTTNYQYAIGNSSTSVPYTSGGVSPDCTNAILLNVTGYGDSDVLFVSPSGSPSFFLKNCSFYSKFDNVNIIGNTYFLAENCHFESIGPSALIQTPLAPARGLVTGGNDVAILNNCTVVTENENGASYILQQGSTATNIFNNCYLVNKTTNNTFADSGSVCYGVYGTAANITLNNTTIVGASPFKIVDTNFVPVAGKSGEQVYINNSNTGNNNVATNFWVESGAGGLKVFYENSLLAPSSKGGPGVLTITPIKTDGSGYTNILDSAITGTSNLLAPAAITFPATTVPWTNVFGVPIALYIDNTAVTGTSLSINGTTVFSGISLDETITLQNGESFSEAYTVGTPTAKWHPSP